MSDSEAPSQKKRRLQGACDACRTRKIRCDSATMPGHICTNCLSLRLVCTHEMSNKRKKRGFKAATNPDCVQSALSLPANVSIRVKVATILSRSLANENIVPGNREDAQQLYIELANYIISLEKELESKASKNMAPTGNVTSPHLDDCNEESSYSSDASNSEELLVANMELLQVGNTNTRFFGESSNVMMAMKARSKITQEKFTNMFLPNRRPEYWCKLPCWNLFPECIGYPLIFPDTEYMKHLVDSYFTHVHPFCPGLHRPTFEKSLSAGLHATDYYFGCVVLAVCALGARFSNDPRVLADDPSELQVGWKWFQQIKPYRDLLKTGHQASIYMLQLCFLCLMFLQSTGDRELKWSLVGVGVRLVQEMGAHRKHMLDLLPRHEREQLKRAVWVLTAFDLNASISLGRGRALDPGDFDQAQPAECDDEYWDHSDPEQAFKQPAGKPSVMSCWIHYLKLLEILSFAKSTIFSVRRSGLWKDIFPPRYHRKIMSRIDSALNEWLNSMPEHLCWDPKREDPLFFDQSAFLYASYYYVQIIVHRPFMVLPSQTCAPFFTICANAARSCSRMMKTHAATGRVVAPFAVTSALFNAGVILCLNAWGGRRIGVSSDPTREIQDAYHVLDVLRLYERRWQVPGRHADLLKALILQTNLPAPIEGSAPKRERDEMHDADSSSDPRHTELPHADASRTMYTEQPVFTDFDLQQLATFPFYADNLGNDYGYMGDSFGSFGGQYTNQDPARSWTSSPFSSASNSDSATSSGLQPPLGAFSYPFNGSDTKQPSTIDWDFCLTGAMYSNHYMQSQ